VRFPYNQTYALKDTAQTHRMLESHKIPETASLFYLGRVSCKPEPGNLKPYFINAKDPLEAHPKDGLFDGIGMAPRRYRPTAPLSSPRTFEARSKPFNTEIRAKALGGTDPSEMLNATRLRCSQAFK